MGFKGYQRMRQRVSMTGAALIVLFLTTAPTWAVDLTQQVSFSIRPQRLATALLEFSHQARVQIVVGPEVGERKTAGVSGMHSIGEALSTLLDGSSLSFKVINDTSITVGSAAALQQPSDKATAMTDGGRGVGGDGPAVARAGSTLPIAASGSENPALSSSNGLSEIVVTAQKRAERLQDVPVPVTAISAQSLVDSNQLRLQDYFNTVPGLNFSADQLGNPVLSIRGLTTGGGNPTVGIVIDDVPYGSSTGIGSGSSTSIAPDIDPSDLARIEVLRGPQGTLYGASSIGGLLKYVTLDPSTDRVSGRIQGGFSDVYNGADLGYSVRGAVNVPLSDTVAIRASAFGRRDPGYIDNVETGRRGVNEGNSEGGRLAALWRPSQDLTLKLSALLQNSKTDGSPNAFLQPGLTDLQQTGLPGTGGQKTYVQAYSANLSVKIGPVDVTSISGYGVNTASFSQDLTPSFGPFTQNGIPGTGFNGFGVTGTPVYQDTKTKKFTQEIRASSTLGPRLDWLMGAFYTHESTQLTSSILATDATTGAVAGTWADYHLPSTFEEYAAFTDLTVHVTGQFDIQIGGRESHNNQTYTQTQTGVYNTVFYGLPFAIADQEKTKDNSFTYLVTPQFKVSEDLMVYSRMASGYRPGGPNPLSTVFGVPRSYAPDTTKNYEIGVKGDLFHRALTFDASVYYLDWKDIQLVIIDPVSFQSFFTNASRAKSEGVELSVESKPLSGLTIAAWVVWNDAEITRSLPPGGPNTPVGSAGDRLPFSSRSSANLALTQDVVVTSEWTAFVGGNLSYVGNRVGGFTASPPRQAYPGYAKVDLHAGAKYETWTFNLYANNVTDKRAALVGGVDNFPTYAYAYLTPRTVGISAVKSF
jgi:iron complex outermembrane receptor protein